MTSILISLMAGLATGLGGLIAFVAKREKEHLIGFNLGAASGVMIIVAIQDLLMKGIEIGIYLPVVGSFIGGTIFILLLDLLVPHRFIFSDARRRSSPGTEECSRRHGWGLQRRGLGLKRRGLGLQRRGVVLPRLGLMMALGITIHNIPEGLVVGAGYEVLPAFGIVLGIAIALHNIPEGIAVATPLILGGVRKRKALLIATLSGLSEPLGAALAVGMLSIMPKILPLLLGFAGGVMLYLTIDELLPTAREYGHPHLIGAGLITGLALGLALGIILK